MAFYPAYVVVTSSSWDTAKQTILPRIRAKANIVRKLFPFFQKPTITEWWPYGKNAEHAHGVICCSPTERENIAGRHNSFVLVIIDEGSHIERDIMGGVDGITIKPDDRIIMPGNPLLNSGIFYEAGTINNRDNNPNGVGWKLVQISAYDSPNVKAGYEIIPGVVQAEWVREKEAEWADNPEEFYPRVLGLPPEDTAGTIIGSRAIENAAKVVPPEDSGPVVLSVDPTWGGADKAVFTVRNDAQLIYSESKLGMKEPEILDRILELEEEYKVERIIIDTSGNPSVAHFLEARGHKKIEGVHYAGRPRDTKQFMNQRAEFYFGLRVALKNGFHIPYKYVPALMLQAGVQSVKVGARLKVEDKDNVRVRIGRSPDELDALAQSFYQKPGEAVFETVLAVHKVKRKPTVKPMESGAWACIPEGAGEFFRPSPGHLERFIWIGENSESCAVWVHVDAEGRRIVFDGCRSEASTPEFMYGVVARSKGHRYRNDWMSADQGINALWRAHDEIQRLGGTSLPDFMKYEQISGAEGVDVLDRLHLGTLSRQKDNPFWIGREDERHAHAMRPEWLMYWPEDVLAAMQGARFIGDSGGVNESEKQERIRNGGGGYVRAMRMMAVVSLGVAPAQAVA
jgi:hypothetical protein